MSTRITIHIQHDGIETFGGRVVRAPGELRVEIDPADVRAGHSAIAQLAEEAHEELRLAVERVYDQRSHDERIKLAQAAEAEAAGA